MKVIVFDKNTQKGEFSNYGYGKLRYVQKCEITEELNGRYDLEIILLRKDPKHIYIKKWTILWVDGQLFRVREITQIDKENSIRIYAKHIFYDVGYGFIEDNRAENKTIKEAMQIAIPDDFKNIFDVNSDIEDRNTIYYIKNNGAENIFNIIDRWQQGELKRDNFNISILKSIGKDNGVTFTYKKIDGIEVTEDTEETVTRIYPVGKDGLTLSEKYIVVPSWNTEDHLPFHITKEISFPDVESEGDLRIVATREAEKLGFSKLNFKVNVYDIKDSTLYKDKAALLNVNLGDITTIKHSKLNIRIKVKCIKKVRDLVNKKLNLEFGQPLQNFFANIDNNNVQVPIPDIAPLKEELFYFNNSKVVNLGIKFINLASIRFATRNQTNMMLHLTINQNVIQSGIEEIEFYLNGDKLPFSPKITLEEGYRLFTINYPLIRIPGGTTNILRVTGKLNGKSVIDIEGFQLVLRGQNIDMNRSMESVFTGADVNASLLIDTSNFEFIGKIDFNNKSQVPINNKIGIDSNLNVDTSKVLMEVNNEVFNRKK